MSAQGISVGQDRSQSELSALGDQMEKTSAYLAHVTDRISAALDRIHGTRPGPCESANSPRPIGMPVAVPTALGRILNESNNHASLANRLSDLAERLDTIG